MINEIPDDLNYGAFFFVDIVGLSNPILSTETQRTKIQVLNESIYNSKTYMSCRQEDLFILPTGDGMLIGFKDGFEEPIKLAQDLHEKLHKYNDACTNTEKIKVRIGCNVGHFFVVKDLKGNVSLWGPGAILARRVMDLGDDDHVLVTSNMVEDLIEISEEYSKKLHPIQDFKIKHGEDILVYNAFNEKFGNARLPKKIEKTYTHEKKDSTAKNASCDKINFRILLNGEDANFLKHERTYHISNNGVEPIYDFTLGILTNSEHKFDELGVKIFEDSKETKVSKVFTPTPMSKHVFVKFSNPILKNDNKKVVDFHYTTKDSARHFEHSFLNECKNIDFVFIFRSNSKNIKPKLYHIDNKNITKTIIEDYTVSVEGISTKMSWKINQGVNKKDLIRLEW